MWQFGESKEYLEFAAAKAEIARRGAIIVPAGSPEEAQQLRRAIWRRGRLTTIAGAVLLVFVLCLAILVALSPEWLVELWIRSALLAWLLCSLVTSAAALSALRAMDTLNAARGRPIRFAAHVALILGVVFGAGVGILLLLNVRCLLVFPCIGNYLVIPLLILQLALFLFGAVVLIRRSMTRLNWFPILSAFLWIPFLAGITFGPAVTMCLAGSVLFPACWLVIGLRLERESQRILTEDEMGALDVAGSPEVGVVVPEAAQEPE